jgi:phosphoglycerate dehydrogenase-like enzyme
MQDLRKCRILVTPRTFGEYDRSLLDILERTAGEVIYNRAGRPLRSRELQERLPGCDGYIAGLDEIDRPAMEAAGNLKVISRYGAGLDNIDLEAARELGIAVTHTPRANTASVAELTLGLMLAIVRRIPWACARTAHGEWPHLRGASLAGKVIGLLGLGRIGQAVAALLQPFGPHVVAFDPRPEGAFASQHAVELTSRLDLVNRSDLISLHVPLSPATKHLVDGAFLAHMKPGAYLVNTSRGEVIDESALIEALQCGRLAGAALDVLTQEPPQPDHPLLSMEQVIITPHIGSHTDQAANEMGWTALRDCLAVLGGREPQFRVI